MQSVRQFDHNDPDIIRHSENHFSDTLSLTGLRTAVKRKNTQLRYPGNNIRNLLSKNLIYFFRCGMGVFNHIMQETGGDADNIEFHVCENTGHL